MSATSERFQRSVVPGVLCALHNVKLIADKAINSSKWTKYITKTYIGTPPTQLNQESFRTRQTALFPLPPLSQRQFCDIAILWPPYEFILAVDLIDKCGRSGSVHLDKFYRLKDAVSALKPTSEQLQDADSSKLTEFYTPGTKTEQTLTDLTRVETIVSYKVLLNVFANVRGRVEDFNPPLPQDKIEEGGCWIREHNRNTEKVLHLHLGIGITYSRISVLAAFSYKLGSPSFLHLRGSYLPDVCRATWIASLKNVMHKTSVRTALIVWLREPAHTAKCEGQSHARVIQSL